MQPAETSACEHCLRPKYSDADLERWRTEVAEFTRLGGDGEKYNPEWARAICWTKRDVKCGCKPGPISITVTHQ